jgi:nitrate/TMAO reductase-like tetraheme cytochrome c subunit
LNDIVLPTREAATEEAADMSSSEHRSTRPYWNWLSLVGAYITFTGMAAALFVYLIEWRLPHTNIYLAVVLFGLLPAVMMTGLLLVVVGIFREARRRRRVGDRYAPQIDLTKLRHRQIIGVAFAIGTLFLVLSMYGAFRSYEITESKEFCGEVCHSVMHPEYVAHQNSPHARVDCVQCHVGPGAEHLVMAKVRGLQQMVAMVKGNYTKPIPTPLKHLRPARDICEQCHWPEKFFDKVTREHAYFLPDEENSRFNTSLLIHVGGGGEEKIGLSGAASGIHWHMALDNEVFYIATDDRKQKIPWVKMVTRDGKEKIYRADDLEESDEELLAKYEVNKVDCIDCHNRAVHQFPNPQRTLNAAMLMRRIDPSIPYIKRRGLEVLRAEYTTQAEGVNKIREQLVEYYATEYPEFWAAQQPLIEAAIKEIQGIYQRTIFPEMKADWRAHPDNIGHTFSNGCFRCHDDFHKTTDGEVIRKDCNICHEVVGQGPGTNVPPFTGIQDYIHPEDIGDLWRDSLCTDCHTGAGAD